MAGSVAVRIDPPGQLRRTPQRAHWLVLVIVAVAAGLLVGALGCAAGLAAAAPHGNAQPSVSHVVEMHTAHAADPASSSLPAPRSMQHDGHGDHSESNSMVGSHPGMACVVSVDLQAREPSPVSVSASHDTPSATMGAGYLADLDPPVPRPS